MKNSKGISLIALIITIIVIIILAAIVIGGVFNTPNDAKFANFCQQYDELQTAIQLRYYSLYQTAAISNSTATVPSRFDLYKQVAVGGETPSNTAAGWIGITNFGSATGALPQPSLGTDGWFLRTNDGKLAYKGFQKENGVYYYTPSSTTGNTQITSATTGFDSVVGNAN